MTIKDKGRDYGVAEEAARLFHQQQAKNNWYRGLEHEPEQRATLDVYQQQVVPTQRENEELRIELEQSKMADLVGEMGVHSRRALDSRLSRKAERLITQDQKNEARSTSKGLLIVMADLDGLKMINEASPDPEAGHAVGDAALCKIAATMIGCVRPQDIVARVGGDEYGAIIEADSKAVAEKIIKPDPADQAQPGLIERLRAGAEQERQVLSREYGDAWPKDVGPKKPGQISVGWSFVSEVALAQLYRQYQMMPRGINNGRKHDFLSLVFMEADRMMMSEKRKKSF